MLSSYRAYKKDPSAGAEGSVEGGNPGRGDSYSADLADLPSRSVTPDRNLVGSAADDHGAEGGGRGVSDEVLGVRTGNERVLEIGDGLRRGERRISGGSAGDIAESEAHDAALQLRRAACIMRERSSSPGCPGRALDPASSP